MPASTEINREVIDRIGQERFRDARIDYWGGRCAVTGLSIVPRLGASHVKPWAACSTAASCTVGHFEGSPREARQEER